MKTNKAPSIYTKLAVLAVSLLAILTIAVLFLARLSPTSAAGVIPVNDNFPGTVVAFLPFNDGSLSTAKATTEAGEPSPCGGIAKTVWYEFTPSVTTVLQADTISSDYDTVLAVYTGASLPTLVNIACNDDFFGKQSKIQFTATAGTTYRIQAGGFNATTGNLVFNLAPPPPPPNPPTNDNLNGGSDAGNGGYSDQVYTGTATNEAGESSSSTCGTITRTVWYNFTPAQSYPVVEVKTFDPDLPKSSDYDTVIAVYSGPPVPTTFGLLSPLIPPACNDNAPGHGKLSLVQFAATVGTTYHIQVGGHDGSVGNLHFSLTIPPPTPTPSPTDTRTWTPTGTRTSTPKPTLTPNPTPTLNPTANGLITFQADCEGTPKRDTLSRRIALVGQSFHVCVFGTVPTPGSAAGYQVRVHWGEDILDLTPRSAPENDVWQGSACMPLGGVIVTQNLGPPDDESGSDAYIELRALGVDNSPCASTTKLAEFEFVCQVHGATNIEMRDPGTNTYFKDQGMTLVKPTLKSAVIICLQPEFDSDSDGCTNVQEMGVNPARGGGRDPTNPWDFFDPTGDGRHRTNDITVVVYHYGHNASPPGDPLYSTKYDRSPLGVMGANPWQFGPPDGVIRSFDITAAVVSYGNDCA